MNAFILVGGVALTAALFIHGRRYVAQRREAFIRHAELPKGLFERLQKRHPDLSLKDCQLVAHGLRQFFLAHLKSGRRFVSMPSQVVDDLWHEYILYTKNYDRFCRQAFGRFLHHTPAVVLGRAQQGNAGLRRCWWYACKEENINPRAATRLPLLFALDSKLGIPGDFATSRIASRCGARTSPAPMQPWGRPIAAPTSPILRSTARSMGLVMPVAAGMARRIPGLPTPRRTVRAGPTVVVAVAAAAVTERQNPTAMPSRRGSLAAT